jgi:hypothetical protein
VIIAFKHNFHYYSLKDNLERNNPKTMQDLVSIATRYAKYDKTSNPNNDDDDVKGKSRKDEKNLPKGNDNGGGSGNNKRKSDESHIVANFNTNGKQGGYKGPWRNSKANFMEEIT